MDSGRSSNGRPYQCMSVSQWKPNSAVNMSWNIIKRHTGKVSNTSDVIGKVKTVSRWSKSATGGGLTWSVVMVRAPQISRSHSGPVSPLLLSTATREQGGINCAQHCKRIFSTYMIIDYRMTGPFIPTYVASHFYCRGYSLTQVHCSGNAGEHFDPFY